MKMNAQAVGALEHPRLALVTIVGAARAQRCRGDLVAGRRQHVPRCAEPVEALAVGLAGLAVALVAVERVAVVRDLWLAVGPRCRAEQRALRPVAGRGFPLARSPPPPARRAARAPS